MAINIFSGGSGGSRKINTATNSSRAQAAKSALTGPAETSSSGSTAVKTSGTLSKIGNTVGKVAGIAAKFLPGIGGTIANGIASLFNDPEWWQQVPGDAVTLNSPLRPIKIASDVYGTGVDLYSFRASIGSFESTRMIVPENELTGYVMEPTDQSVTQYLMPQIRKVVNAIPLQSADSYKVVLQVNATLYALWRQLTKIDYMLKHGQTYLANMNDPMFPLFQVENAAYLQSTINRLEEYLRANVRLPHTLCEYLAWRFGRVYKSNDSAKAGLITYDVVGYRCTPALLTQYIGNLMNTISSDVSYQQANTDVYNAYYDHDLLVEIREDTQFSYDCKEFMLRTNCDFGSGTISDGQLNNVYVDSRLDNPTTFMASTVSTIGTADDGSRSWLFPIITIHMWFPSGPLGTYYAIDATVQDGAENVYHTFDDAPGSIWSGSVLYELSQFYNGTKNLDYSMILVPVAAAKALDIYNKDQLMFVKSGAARGTVDSTILVDLTSLSMDMGQVDDRVLGIEHVYAFANLVDIDRKHSMSYAKAEKLVARDTAELVEKLDISTVSDKNGK